MLELVMRQDGGTVVVRVVRGLEVCFEVRGSDRDLTLEVADAARVKLLARAFMTDPTARAGYRLREEPAPMMGALEADDLLVCRHGGVV